MSHQRFSLWNGSFAHELVYSPFPWSGPLGHAVLLLKFTSRFSPKTSLFSIVTEMCLQGSFPVRNSTSCSWIWVVFCVTLFVVVNIPTSAMMYIRTVGSIHKFWHFLTVKSHSLRGEKVLYSPCLWIWNSGALHWNRPHELIIWVSLKINNFRSLARSIHISTLPCPCSPYLEDSQRSKYPVLWLAISTKLKMRCNQGTREQEIFTAGVSWKSYCKHCYLCLRRTHGNWADICCSLWLGINIHFLPEFMTVSGGTNLFMLAEQGKVSLLRMFRVKDLS